ncbi:34-kDa subunit of RNA polymerase III (C) [Kappamyces sp. JEL0829]|nr:34-kDa subunit of RNA polymerase III (C) [Kappamyces sp. JEL0829]
MSHDDDDLLSDPIARRKKEELLFQTILSSKSGLTNDGLKERLPDWTQQELTECLNEMAENQTIEFLTLGGKLVFKARDGEEVAKLQNMTDNERIVYQFIKDAGNKGTWLKHIKDKSGLHTKVVTDAIGKLEKKSLIKNIKSVKKVYMLSEFEPSVDLTGGSWYTDNVMDVEFIDQLSTQIFKFIHAKSRPPSHPEALYSLAHEYPTSIEEIHSFITRSGLTSHPLSQDDIQALVNRLVYDGVVQVLEEGIYVSLGTLHQKKGAGPLLGSALTDAPCGTCPVFRFCKDGAPVSPSSCIYFKDWLEY